MRKGKCTMYLYIYGHKGFLQYYVFVKRVSSACETTIERKKSTLKALVHSKSSLSLYEKLTKLFHNESILYIYQYIMYYIPC